MPVLRSCDDVPVIVPREAAIRSKVISNLFTDINPNDDVEIPITNIKGEILTKVMEYCKYHMHDPMPPEDDNLLERKQTEIVSQWDADFINVDQSLLFEIIIAANYLDIQPLLNLGCQTVAASMKDKTAAELRKKFNIENDFTPEEEEQIRKENEWAEDR